MTKARQLADLGNVYDDGALSNINLIINGAMQVAQRGTTGTSTAGGYLSVDRFSYVRSAYTPSITRSQETDSPSGFSNSYKALTSTAASVPSNGYTSIFQYIEAQNLQHLEYGSSTAKTVTLSFWAKSNVTGTFASALTTFDTSNLFNSATYAISSANTWEYKTITFDGQTTNAINNDAGAGIRVEWCLSSGSDRTSGSNGVWSSPAANRFAGHSVDITGTINNFLSITGVQLEVGDTATPFEHRSYGDELAKCQRYYLESRLPHLIAVSNGENDSSTVLPSTMRTAPTVTLSSIVNASLTVQTPTVNSFGWNGTANNGANGNYSFYFSCDSEL